MPARVGMVRNLLNLCWGLCKNNFGDYGAGTLAAGEARRGSMSAGTCDRGATKPKAIFGATLRAAGLLASGFVAHSLQTHGGMLVACASPEAKIPCGKTPAI